MKPWGKAELHTLAASHILCTPALLGIKPQLLQVFYMKKQSKPVSRGQNSDADGSSETREKQISIASYR